MVTDKTLPFERNFALNSFTNATQNGAVLAHVLFPSTKAKPSKSKSIPSKLFAFTNVAILSTTCVRVLGFANNPESTNFAVPSVIVGTIDNPARFIKHVVVAIGHEGLPDAYSLRIEVALLRENQKGFTSFIRSAFV